MTSKKIIMALGRCLGGAGERVVGGVVVGGREGDIGKLT